MQPIISVAGLSKTYASGFKALDHIDLDIRSGEIFALLGPNGAGKTTLLRALAGLVQRAAGEVEVAGIDPREEDRRTVARHVAFVDQRPVLPPGMRVAEYVLLGRTAHVGTLRMETTRDLDVAREAMARLDVERFAERDVLTLSGGEGQRVVLARALAQEAPVLLLDEPTSALDLGHKQQVLELVDELRRERDLTVVTTMHDLTVAGQFATSVAMLERGRLAAHGPVDEVLDPTLIARVYGAQVQVVRTTDGTAVVVPVRHQGAT